MGLHTHAPPLHPPSPPHHLPQPLPLFLAPISRHVEKMLSRISHFQRVGVADSGPKIWTITPPDSSRVPPRPGEGSCSTEHCGLEEQCLAELTAHFHGEMKMERRTGSPGTSPRGAFPKFSPAFRPRTSPGQEPQAFSGVCLGALHRLHPCRERGCVAPALSFLHVALPKEPRAPRQKDEVIYLRPDNVLRYTPSHRR